jgi:hypothetical protein
MCYKGSAAIRGELLPGTTGPCFLTYQPKGLLYACHSIDLQGQYIRRP